MYVCILYVHLLTGKNIDMIPTSLDLFYVCMYVHRSCMLNCNMQMNLRQYGSYYLNILRNIKLPVRQNKILTIQRTVRRLINHKHKSRNRNSTFE